MMDTSQLFTERGKKYCFYLYKTAPFIMRIPFFGKYIIGVIVSGIFQLIIAEGAKENARRKKAKMSGMRNGASNGRRSASGEVRKVRIQSGSVRGIQATNGRVQQNNQASETTKGVNLQQLS